MAEVKKSFVAAMKGYFGIRPGTSVADFSKELKDLTPKDKEEFHTMLIGAGVDCLKPGEMPPK